MQRSRGALRGAEARLARGAGAAAARRDHPKIRNCDCGDAVSPAQASESQARTGALAELIARCGRAANLLRLRSARRNWARSADENIAGGGNCDSIACCFSRQLLRPRCRIQLRVAHSTRRRAPPKVNGRPEGRPFDASPLLCGRLLPETLDRRARRCVVDDLRAQETDTIALSSICDPRAPLTAPSDRKARKAHLLVASAAIKAAKAGLGRSNRKSVSTTPMSPPESGCRAAQTESTRSAGHCNSSTGP